METGRKLSLTGPGWPSAVEAVEVAVCVVEMLDHLPPLRRIDQVAVAPRETDVKRSGLLVKIRALLAKAESSEFSEEADAYTAKATELMLRHRIDKFLARQQDRWTRRWTNCSVHSAIPRFVRTTVLAMRPGWRRLTSPT